MKLREHLACLLNWHDWMPYGEGLCCRRCLILRPRFPATERALRESRRAYQERAEAPAAAREEA